MATKDGQIVKHPMKAAFGRKGGRPITTGAGILKRGSQRKSFSARADEIERDGLNIERTLALTQAAVELTSERLEHCIDAYEESATDETIAALREELERLVLFGQALLKSANAASQIRERDAITPAKLQAMSAVFGDAISTLHDERDKAIMLDAVKKLEKIVAQR